mmetsp:Transcript_22117/g.43536  ORF Transcript_22117/g.43536 Transcript_22117/m.43536 type:complete len:210 (+) Transcript_22117:279-908(+)
MRRPALTLFRAVCTPFLTSVATTWPKCAMPANTLARCSNMRAPSSSPASQRMRLTARRTNLSSRRTSTLPRSATAASPSRFARQSTRSSATVFLTTASLKKATLSTSTYLAMLTDSTETPAARFALARSPRPLRNLSAFRTRSSWNASRQLDLTCLSTLSENLCQRGARSTASILATRSVDMESAPHSTASRTCCTLTMMRTSFSRQAW